MPAALVIPRTYAELRREVEQVLGDGRKQVEEAWVNTYHETGRLIHEHILQQQARADYGGQVYARLSTDTGVSARTLQECVQFYRQFPIARPVAQFGWNRCRLLCQVGDEAERKALVAEMRRGNLPTVELKARVRALNAAARQAAETANASAGRSVAKRIPPRRCKVGHYRLVERDGQVAVDAGFKLYQPLPDSAAKRLKAGMIVSHSEDAFTEAAGATIADLFTYQAIVRRVVDGDTLAVTVLLPGYEMDETLRLRGVDCPEMNTPEGKAAKRYVEIQLLGVKEVTIATTKPDKYDRYLADVFIRRPGGSGEEIFLNNALLAAGHAVPMGTA